MFAFVLLLPFYLCSATLEQNATLVAHPRPQLERMTRLTDVVDAFQDLYLASDPGTGIWQAPTWVGVYTDTDETDLTGASFIWKSGLDWFANINMHDWMVGGKFTSQGDSLIEVVVILADQRSITLSAWLKRERGCWTEWEDWTAEPFVDAQGETWPLTKLYFDFPTLAIQNAIYYVPNTTCRATMWSNIPSFWCGGIAGSVDMSSSARKIVWPNDEACTPAIKHAVDYIYFWGEEGTMSLEMSGVTQVFKGTPVKSMVTSTAVNDD